MHEVEQALVTVLPGDLELNPAGRDKRAKVIVQPDATITSSSVFALVEAKRIRRTSFQPEQLAREYVAATVEAKASGRRPLLLLILGSTPPVAVTGWPGPVAIPEAIERHLASVISRTPRCAKTSDEMVDGIDNVVAWTTWTDIAGTTADRAAHLDSHLEPSVIASLQRLATAVTDAVERHS